jgi:hypothetical protein
MVRRGGEDGTWNGLKISRGRAGLKRRISKITRFRDRKFMEVGQYVSQTVSKVVLRWRWRSGYWGAV